MTASPRLPWQFYLLGALGLALTIGLLFVAFTVAIVLLPLVLVAVLWQRWRWQQRLRAAMAQAPRAQAPGARPADGKPVIEGDYVVVDETRPDPR